MQNREEKRARFHLATFITLLVGLRILLCAVDFSDIEITLNAQEERTLEPEELLPKKLITSQVSKHSVRRNVKYRAKDAADIKLPPFSREESFGGCLLLLDQNHRLAEWIAYHYFALPLRTIIIAYDPKTKDRPTELLERWKNVITIIEWADDDYLPTNWAKAPLVFRYRWKKITPALERHEQRQLLFVQKCHERSVEMGIRRTLLLDPDEYLRVNPDVIPSTIVNTSEPGHITKLYQLLEAHNNTLLTEQEGVTYKANCSVYPRVQYTTMAPNQLYSVPKDIEYTEAGLVDPFYYNTLRYRYRNMYRMKQPKGIVDAMDGVPHQIVNIHFPLDLQCNKSAYTLGKSPFLVNHYIGSFDDFLRTFRNDARNDVVKYTDIRSKWEIRARGLGDDHPFDFHLYNPLIKDESITNWVPAFFTWQSEEVATMLLDGAGLRPRGSLS